MRYILLLTLVLTAMVAYRQGSAKLLTGSEVHPQSTTNENNRLGLPPLPIPVNNPQTPAKIALGDKLFHDQRFSVDGTVSCSKCHDDKLAFTDRLPVSTGHHGLPGTRNAPTVLNAAFNKSQFWDGREPDLEGQAKQPLINPVEHGLSNHNQMLEIIRTDPDYLSAFQSVFEVNAKKLTIDHVAQAIASFERTLIAGDSPFDRYYFKGQAGTLTEPQYRGFQLFIGQGRCVSCHTIEQNHALFTDGRFHNIGIGINQIQQDIPRLTQAFLEAKNKGENVDKMVLTDKKTSPQSYARAEQYLPKLTVPMNRADPFFERDATGWQFINLADGNADMNFTLYSNTSRIVRYNDKQNRPEDAVYQDEKARIIPQTHY